MKPALKKKIAEDLRLRGYAVRTQETYLSNICAFGAWHRRSPDDLGTEDVRAWLLHRKDQGYAPATLSQCYAALRVFYTTCLLRPEVMAEVPRPRVPKQRIGIPLTMDEGPAVLRQLADTPQYYAIVAMLIETGMRINEVRHLQVKDIDARNGLVHIRHGKGGKVRAVGLSDRLLRILRRYWTVRRPVGPWLFPARQAGRRFGGTQPVWKSTPVCADAVRSKLHRAASRAGLNRKVTPHDLRRSYATWLLESGVDLRIVQVVLGHSSPETTARYTYVRPELLKRLPSGLDMMRG